MPDCRPAEPHTENLRGTTAHFADLATLAKDGHWTGAVRNAVRLSICLFRQHHAHSPRRSLPPLWVLGNY